MTDKVAVITGASQGIGAGVVAGYRGLGWAVVASSRASDVVDGILFLESSPYITGEIVHIDGGQIAGH